MNNNKINYYKLIPFITIVFIIAKFIFTQGFLSTFFEAFKTLFLAFILIYLLEPLVNFLQKKLRIKRTLSVVLSYILFFALVIFIILLIVPSITDSIVIFIKSLPSDYESFVEKINSLNIFGFHVSENELENLFASIINKLTQSLTKILDYSKNILGSIAIIASKIATFFIALFMAFYALKDNNSISNNIKNFIKKIFNRNISTFIIKVGRITDDAIKNFLVGKIISCVLLGLLTYLSIIIINIIFRLDIPYAPLFGFLIGVTNIIPYIGPFLGTIPCVLISLFYGLPEAIAVLAIILAMQQVDNIIISPKILNKALGVKPFWIIASITIGGSLFGVLGMVLSVPLAAVIQTLFKEYYGEKKENT